MAPRALTLATGAAAAGLGLAVRPSRGGAPAAGSAAAASTLREAPVTAEASICWHTDGGAKADFPAGHHDKKPGPERQLHKGGNICRCRYAMLGLLEGGKPRS